MSLLTLPIYLFELADNMKIDLPDAIMIKLEKMLRSILLQKQEVLI